MRDPQDIVEIPGVQLPPAVSAAPGQSARDAAGARRKFLQVHFTCCHAYGRMTLNPDGLQYVGRCPSCGAVVRALVGRGGTSRRTFEAR